MSQTSRFIGGYAVKLGRVIGASFDIVWHYHILNTEAYIRDTTQIFSANTRTSRCRPARPVAILTKNAL